MKCLPAQPIGRDGAGLYWVDWTTSHAHANINAFFFHYKICICDFIYHTNGIGSLKKRSTPEELSNLD